VPVDVVVLDEGLAMRRAKVRGAIAHHALREGRVVAESSATVIRQAGVELPLELEGAERLISWAVDFRYDEPSDLDRTGALDVSRAAAAWAASLTRTAACRPRSVARWGQPSFRQTPGYGASSVSAGAIRNSGEDCG
jgi:hypothetical protein